MRLSEIYSNLSVVDVNKYRLAADGSYGLKNLNSFKELINYIDRTSLDFYDEEIQYLKESSIYSTTQDSINFNSSNMQSSIYHKAKYILDSIDSLNIVLNKLVPKSNETDFLIKLPKPDTFELLLNDMSNIQKQLSIIVNDKSINSTIDINNWEYGSYWVNIAVGTALTVQILASITWSAAYISSQMQQAKAHELYIERLSIENSMLKAIQEKQKVQLNKLVDTEIMHINEKHFENKHDNERDKKIKDTIKLFADIILRGGEFQPSLISTKDIKDSFPDFKNIENIQSQVKQITAKPKK